MSFCTWCFATLYFLFIRAIPLYKQANWDTVKQELNYLQKYIIDHQNTLNVEDMCDKFKTTITAPNMLYVWVFAHDVLLPCTFYLLSDFQFSWTFYIVCLFFLLVFWCHCWSMVDYHNYKLTKPSPTCWSYSWVIWSCYFLTEFALAL
jgi:hypothetical protein